MDRLRCQKHFENFGGLPERCFPRANQFESDTLDTLLATLPKNSKANMARKPKQKARKVCSLGWLVSVRWCIVLSSRLLVWRRLLDTLITRCPRRGCANFAGCIVLFGAALLSLALFPGQKSCCEGVRDLFAWTHQADPGRRPQAVERGKREHKSKQTNRQTSGVTCNVSLVQVMYCTKNALLITEIALVYCVEVRNVTLCTWPWWVHTIADISLDVGGRGDEACC